MFEVRGKKFTLSIDDAGVRCTPDDPGDAVLCDVVTLGWQAGPERLLAAVRAGYGLGLVGEAGFTYYDDAADEFPAGAPSDSVLLDFFDRSQVLDREVFEAFVNAFAERVSSKRSN